MELTWISIAASLAMGSGAAFLFIFAVKRDWMRNIEDAKYQVFWSDVEELVDAPPAKVRVPADQEKEDEDPSETSD